MGYSWAKRRPSLYLRGSIFLKEATKYTQLFLFSGRYRRRPIITFRMLGYPCHVYHILESRVYILVADFTEHGHNDYQLLPSNR
jgi:hypothetical protein